MQPTLKLDLVLNNQGLVLVVNWLRKLGRNSVVSSRILDNKTSVAFHTLEDMWLLDSPLANVCPLLILLGTLHVLLCMGWLPSLLPIIRELLEEVCLDVGWLSQS